MKKIITCTAIALLMALSSCNPYHQYSDLNETKGINMVYTSSALFSLTGGIASKISGVDLKDVINKVGSVRLIIADNSSATKKARKVVSYQLHKIGATPLMEISGAAYKNNSSGIYVTPIGENVYDHVAIVNDNGTNYQAIILDGKITLADLLSITK